MQDNPDQQVISHKPNQSSSFPDQGIINKESSNNNLLTFKIIKNDQQRQSLKLLIDLKNIFFQQIPKMPKQYIVKLMFDRYHQSMVIRKKEGKVFGGVSFRVFQEERFAEIAFLAISSNQRIKGYGTRLMNKLKQEMQKRKIEYLITYADNLALGYFRKQGFSKDCTMSPEKLKGYIKDYEGSTMMECHIHPTIDYSRVSDIIKTQKDSIIHQMKKVSINDVEYDGKILEKLAHGYTRINNDGEQQHYRIDPMSIPGIAESRWDWSYHQQTRKTKQIYFHFQCLNIIEMLKRHQSSWPFKEPVSKDDAPDYETIIKEPIDLKTIQMKLNNNQYLESQTFCDDIKRMFTNSRTFNPPESFYYKCANQLQEYISPRLIALLDHPVSAPLPNSRKKQKQGHRNKPEDKNIF